jgi:hypothetical protein
MSGRNYHKIFCDKEKATIAILQACPKCVHKSGIYFYLREDFEGKHGYIGKAVDLCNRNVSHLLGHAQHIDISLKSRGFYSEDNPSGWKLNVLYYPLSELDMWERHWIEEYRKAGYHLYNVESGGTEGKEIIGERKPPKTYRDGLVQGRKVLARELRHIIDTHLDVTVRKNNKIAQKALDKFWALINFESKKEE